jgi:hypothetical protein
MYPFSKIIFSERNLDDFLVSIYNQYVKQGGIKEFYNFIKYCINWEKLDFPKYINHLYYLFGEKNVHVAKFGVLKKNPEKFVEKISKFIGVPRPIFSDKRHNIAYGKRQIEVALVLNRFFKTRFNLNGKIPYMSRFPRFFPPRALLANRYSYWLNYQKHKPELPDIF